MSRCPSGGNREANMTKANNVSIPAYKEERRAGRGVVHDIAQAVRTGDFEPFLQCMAWLFCNPDFLAAAMRAIAKCPRPSADFCTMALEVWVKHGDNWRSEVQDDLALADALRTILPPYTGPAITLYRGETVWNRKRRTYGFSWTAKEEIAHDFSNRLFCRASEGGSALLRTVAPTEAIICAPGLIDNRYAEQEYLVDRRRLGAVEVLERYPQL